MKIAIIDDSSYKIEGLSALIKANWPTIEVVVARSFQTGMSLLEKERPEIILMDMSLPNFEKPSGRLEGRNRLFGGRELMEEIDFLGLNSRVVVITQFEEFPDGNKTMNVDELFSRIKSAYPTLFAGGVFYSSIDTRWVADVRKIIDLELLR